MRRPITGFELVHSLGRLINDLQGAQLAAARHSVEDCKPCPRALHEKGNIKRMAQFARQARLALQATDRFERLVARYQNNIIGGFPESRLYLKAPLRVAVASTEQVLVTFREAHITAKVISATATGAGAGFAKRLAELLRTACTFIRQFLRSLHEVSAELDGND